MFSKTPRSAHGGAWHRSVLAELEKRQVRAMAMGPNQIRMVTHLDVSRDQVLEACDAIRAAFKALHQKKS